MRFEKFRGDATARKWAVRDIETVDKVLRLEKRRRVAVQAGANIGVFPAYLSQHFDQVVTFEPHAGLFVTMTANAPQPNIVRMQCGLGAAPDLVAMRDRTETRTHAGVTHVAGPGSVPVITLDSVPLQALDLLYLDIEGYELYALQGALAHIERHTPTIVVEVNGCYRRYGIEPGAIGSLLGELGYVHVLKHRSDQVWQHPSFAPPSE